MTRDKIETRQKSRLSVDKILFAPEDDLVLNAYEDSRAGAFVLARTFRSGSSNGVETELAYLENEPGYIFCNPTTVIGKSIPSKTISQLPGNDWSGQPSFLFTIQSNLQSTIANQGLASLNSFSSTDAIGLMGKFNKREKKVREPLTLSQKMQELQKFLTIHWRDKIADLKDELDKQEGKTPLLRTKKATKEFAKPFEYYFHSTEEYNSLLSSLETLHDALERANNLTLVTRDVTLKPHPVAQIIHAKSHPEPLPDHNNLSHELKKIIADKVENNTADKFNRMKSLLFRAVGALKSSEIAKDTETSLDRFASLSPEKTAERKAQLAEESSIYDNYCHYLDTGARHNEFVSRVYPWEISGIEWGNDKPSKLNAISDLVVTINKKIMLYHELVEHGITHPLFIDFMINKLSLEYGESSYQQLRDLLSDSAMQTEQVTILAEIKLQLQNPVCIYEYSPVKTELINISAIVADYRDTLMRNEEEPLVIGFKDEFAEQCNFLFEEGLQAHIDKLERLTSIDLDGETDSDTNSVDSSLRP